jgi:hypothetical protein
MSVIDLSDQEWGVLMSILADAPWKVSNPLLMKIGEQLRAAHMQPQQTPLHSNGQEVQCE